MNSTRLEANSAPRRFVSRVSSVCLLLAGLGVVTAPAHATTCAPQLNSAEAMEGVEIDQHLEAQLPLDASFRNTDGETETLGDSFDELPVILTLNYVDCPQQCSLQLAELTSAMAVMDLSLGKDYRVVTISIDPKDTPEKATGLEERYLTQYEVQSGDAEIARALEQSRNGWSVLVGTEFQIKRVTDTAGFQYRWVPAIQEYAHRSATILCSPSGEIMRYLPGIGPEMARELRLSLVDAGEGKVGSMWDNIFLSCLAYDPLTGRYSLAAVRLLKVAAALTVLAVVTGFFFMKRGGGQRTDSSVAATDANGGEQTS